MARRRHRRRIAEGADAAAGAVVQRGQRQGARGGEDREAAAVVLGLERDDRDQPERATSRTRRRPICSTGSPRRSTCCSPKGSTSVFARHDRLAEATRRAVRRLGARDPVRRPCAVQLHADRRDDARGPQRRRLPQGRPRTLRHVARPGPGQGRGEDLSHRNASRRHAGSARCAEKPSQASRASPRRAACCAGWRATARAPPRAPSAAGARSADRAAAARARAAGDRAPRSSSSPCRRRSGIRAGSPCSSRTVRAPRARAPRRARRGRSGRTSARRSVLARPRVRCSSSRVAR